MRTAVKRIDGFGEYSPEVVEEKRAASVSGEDFGELVEKYKQFIFGDGQWTLKEMVQGDLLTEILEPQQINHFLQITTVFEDHERYWNTGTIVSGLIQNSYNAGHNDFTLDVRGIRRITNVGDYCRGEEGNCLKIEIEGDIEALANEVEYLDAVAHGSVKYCGMEARTSTFEIHGDALRRCGEQSYESAFLIDGDVITDLGREAHKSSFTIGGRIFFEIGRGARDCTFKTKRTDNIKVLNKNLPKGNRIIQINPDGSEREIWRWKDYLPEIKRKPPVY